MMIVDEPANMRDILKLQLQGDFRPIDYEWGFGQATLVFYPTILLMKLGVTDMFFSLRLTSVVLSLLTLIPFFFLVKKFTNTTTAFSTTLLFSFSYYYLQFSRVGWTNIHSLLLGLLEFWFISLAFEKMSYRFFVLAGIFAGLVFYTYRAGEIYIVGGLLFLLVELLRKRFPLRKKIIVFSLFLSVALGTGLPWLTKISKDWELYNLRAKVVSVFNAEKPYHGLVGQNDIMRYQIQTTLSSWVLLFPQNGGGIENPRYLPPNYPILSIVPALLFYVGLIVGIKKLLQTAPFYAMFVAGLIFGQILTVDPPNGSRGLILLPIMYLFCGLGLFFLQSNFSWMRKLSLLTVVVSLIAAYSDFRFYQYWMSWIKV